MDIEAKLDILDEYHSQKDSIEAQKRTLLDEVKIPAEIEQVVSEGMKAIAEVEQSMRAEEKDFYSSIETGLAAIVIPQELKDALEEIDRQRTEIMTKFQDVEKQKQFLRVTKSEHDAELLEKIGIRKAELQAEIEQKTRDVYAGVEQRRAEIEAEFKGKAEAVDENIAKLEQEIKDEVKLRAAEKLAANPKSKDLSVKGKFFTAVYSKARKTWVPAKLDDYVETHPDIKDCYTEGDPSISIRRV